MTISSSITTIDNTIKSKRRPKTTNSNKDINDNSKSNDVDHDPNSSDASDTDDTAYNSEEYGFTCGSKLMMKYMRLTTGTEVGANILPGFDRSSHASLSRDITEQAKIISTDLVINDIKAWKNSCTVETFGKEIEGSFMKTVRNIRTGIIVIDALKTKPDVLEIKKQAEDRLLEYKIVCQRDLTKYVRIELTYYKEHRYTIFEVALSKVVHTAAKERRTLKLQQAKIQDSRSEETQILQQMKTNELTYITKLFILSGPACDSISKWGEFASNNEMMERLTRNFTGNKRFERTAHNRIKIGTVIVARPHSRMLTMARSIATDLGPIIADMTLGLWQKFLALVIYRKTRYVTQNHIKKAEGYSATAGIMDLLMAKSPDYANTEKANVLKDRLVNDVITKLKKRTNAINNNRNALASEETKKAPPGNEKIAQEQMAAITKANTIANRNQTKTDGQKNKEKDNEKKRKSQSPSARARTKKRAADRNKAASTATTKTTTTPARKENGNDPERSQKEVAARKLIQKEENLKEAADRKRKQQAETERRRKAATTNKTSTYQGGYQGGYKGSNNDGRDARFQHQKRSPPPPSSWDKRQTPRGGQDEREDNRRIRGDDRRYRTDDDHNHDERRRSSSRSRSNERHRGGQDYNNNNNRRWNNGHSHSNPSKR